MRPSPSLAALAVLLLAAPAHADTWGPPDPSSDYASANGRFVFRVVLEKKAVRGSLLEKESVLWAATLPTVPLHALASEDGNYVATFDTHGRAGYGPNVVVLYGPKGKLVRAYSLEDLLSAEELLQVAHSVSSRWWRGHSPGGKERFDLAKGELIVPAHLGGPRLPRLNAPPTKELRISLADGRILNRAAEPPKDAAALLDRYEKAPDDEARALTARLMQELDDPKLRGFWLKQLRERPTGDSIFRLAMRGLEKTGTAADFEELEELFTNREDWVQRWVAQHKGRLAARARAETKYADDLSLLADSGAAPESRRQALKALVKEKGARADRALSIALEDTDSDLRGLGLLYLDRRPVSATHFDAVLALLGDPDPDLARQADELLRDKYLKEAGKQYLPKLEKPALDPKSPVSRAPYVLSRLAELAVADRKFEKAVKLLERLTESRQETLDVLPPHPGSSGFAAFGDPQLRKNQQGAKLGVKANAFARLAAIALATKDRALFEQRMESLRKAPLAGKVCDPLPTAFFPPCQLVPPSEAERVLLERARKELK